MKFTTTGISGLDAQIGGFPLGSTILFLSEPCNAAYTFAEQFAAGGIMKNERIYYCTLERPESEVIQNISELESMSVEKAKRVEVIDLYSRKRKDPFDDVKDVAERVKPPYRFILESVSSLSLESDSERILELFRRIISLGHKGEGVSLVMMTKGMHDQKLEYTMKHLADGVLETGVEKRGFGVYPYIMITKMKGIKGATRMLLYKETDKGLWLESTRRVF